MAILVKAKDKKGQIITALMRRNDTSMPKLIKRLKKISHA